MQTEFAVPLYKYTYSNCKVTYHGKTHRYLITRAAKQMSISNLTGKHFKSVKQSPISDNLLE